MLTIYLVIVHKKTVIGSWRLYIIWRTIDPSGLYIYTECPSLGFESQYA